MTKKLLIERAIAVYAQGSALCESKADGRGYIVESAGSTPGVLMTVKLPATTLDKKNENQRTYRRVIMDSAMTRAKPEFEARSMLSSVNEHPEDPYVTPGQASHIVTGAWTENDGYLWNRWDVMNTASGRDLAALIEAGASFGVSIRGLGSQDNMGNILDDYEYLGTDCVGQPSAKIRTAPTRETPAANEARTESRITPPARPANENAMKNKADATQYVREAAVLMANESPVEAMRRIIRVEATLAECSLPAADLLEAYQLLEGCKDKMEGKNKAPINESGAPAGKPADLLAEAQRGFRAKLIEMANKHKTEKAALDTKLAAANRATRAATARAEALTARALRAAQGAGSTAKVLEMSEASRTRLHAENAKLRVQYSAAADLAVRSTFEAKIAVTEAAKQTVRANKLERKLKAAPAPAAPTTPVKESRRNVVRTGLIETGYRANAATTERHRNVTGANADGTTKVPGFI